MSSNTDDFWIFVMLWFVIIVLPSGLSVLGVVHAFFTLPAFTTLQTIAGIAAVIVFAFSLTVLWMMFPKMKDNSDEG